MRIRLFTALCLLFAFVSCRRAETTTATATESVAATAASAAPPVPQISYSMPADVEKAPDELTPEQNLPYFDDFSWREFVALTWPAKIGNAAPFPRGEPDTTKPYGDTSAPLVFSTLKADYEMFLPNGAPPAVWNSFDTPSPCVGAASPKLVPYEKIIASFNKYHGFNQAGFGVDAGPLVSQNRRYVRYETSVNRLQYDFIINPPSPYPGPLYLAKNLPGTGTNPPLNFPTGSIEIKAGWRVMDNVPGSERARYYVTKAQLSDPVTGRCTAVDVGLVALHIVNKTARFPNWVWSTFEHVDNVPALAGETQGATPPYGLNDPAKPQTLDPDDPLDPISKCNPPLADPAQMQVVRVRAIHKSTQETNRAYRNLAGLKGTVWENYMLTATQWPLKDPAPKDMFPNTIDPKPQTNTANVAAETWFQASTATSCMACHKFSKNKGDDFVWFLPLGAFDPLAPLDPCQARNAFVLATKRVALPKGAAPAKNGRTEAIAALRQFFNEHPQGTP